MDVEVRRFLVGRLLAGDAQSRHEDLADGTWARGEARRLARVWSSTSARGRRRRLRELSVR